MLFLLVTIAATAAAASAVVIVTVIVVVLATSRLFTRLTLNDCGSFVHGTDVIIYVLGLIALSHCSAQRASGQNTNNTFIIHALDTEISQKPPGHL